MIRLNVNEVTNHFDEMITQVTKGERYLIQQANHPLAILINPSELDRLERIAQSVYQLALALGQDNALLTKIKMGQVHPIMAAFGLWADDTSLDNLTEEVRINRDNQLPRPIIL